jgi:hypothetical protein
MSSVIVDDEPRCTIDPERPCRACVADAPWACPYPYLLAGDEPDEASLLLSDLVRGR